MIATGKPDERHTFDTLEEANDFLNEVIMQKGDWKRAVFFKYY